jgi:hypothetical protein
MVIMKRPRKGKWPGIVKMGICLDFACLLKRPKVLIFIRRRPVCLVAAYAMSRKAAIKSI